MDPIKRKEPCRIDLNVLFNALKNSFKLLSPFNQIKNPVMFVSYLGAILSTLYLLFNPFSWFNFQIALWIWLTVLFANFVQALAESRGKAQAFNLKKKQTDAPARLIRDGIEVKVPANDLKKDDVIICEAGDIIAADGEVIKGIATVDESAITGESAPVIRESGGDLSGVTAGTRVISDQLIIRVTSDLSHSFLDRMLEQIDSASYKKTPNEISLSIVLSGFTILFLLAVASIGFFSRYSHEVYSQNQAITLPILIALFVSLIPTTIAAHLNATGITSMVSLIQRNVIAKSSRVVEAAGDIDLMLLDKTGTITLGNRMATAFLPLSGVDEKQFAKIAQLASLSDETPEGRSIVILAKEKYGLRTPELNTGNSRFIPFSAHTRMSGIDFFSPNGKIIRKIRKGAQDVICKHIEKLGGVFPDYLNEMIEPISITGGTPLLVSEDKNIVGIIHLKDVIKGGIKEQFADMRKMGINTVMITGDNALTAAAIAAEAGIDDFIAEANPEMKLRLIRQEQQEGHSVAMIGDGTNDAPALAQADIGVAMNTGTQTSREAGNMVDLDSNPTKLLEIVRIGKQLLITRGALMVFYMTSIPAKYFAVIPTIFGHLYAMQGKAEGPLALLNVMKLHSPKSAVLSTLIFNALIIIALIPLALKGVRYHVQSAYSLVKNKILLYGIGGILIPFIAIKMIDTVLAIFNWV